MRSKKSKNRQNKIMFGGFSKDFQGVFAITVLALLVIIIGIMIYHIYNNSKDAVEHSNLSPQNNCILPTKFNINKLVKLVDSGLKNDYENILETVNVGDSNVMGAIPISSDDYDIEKFKKHIKNLFSDSIFDRNCAFPKEFGIGHIIKLVNSGLKKPSQNNRVMVIPDPSLYIDYDLEDFYDVKKFIKEANIMFTKKN